MLAGALLFTIGFSLVFLTVVVAGSEVGRALFAHKRTVEVIGGVLVATLGVLYMGYFPKLQGTWKLQQLPPVGIWYAPLLGVVFALSWSPCIGPTLGAVLQLSIVSGTQDRALALGSAYCAGIALPFVLCALLFRRLAGIFAAVRRNHGLVLKLGGSLLVAVGLALATGAWDAFTVWLRITFPVTDVLL